MSQIINKFIADNAVDDVKARLRNNQNLRARNNADSGDVNILKVNASDRILFASVPQVASDPSSANDMVRKSYVDALVNGLDWKNSVRLATAAALPACTASGSGVGKTLTGNSNGALSVDSVSVAANDRILVKDQVSGANNGIYVVTQAGDGSNPFILTRATDADENSEVTASLAVFVSEGTVNADSGWTLSTDDPITVDTTSLSFVQFTGSGSITAGNGLTKTGNTLDVVAGDSSIVANADEIHVGLNTGGAIVTSSGIKINLEASNPSLQISGNELGIKFDAAGALSKGSGGTKVNVDGTSIEINSDALRIASGAAGAGLGYSSGVLSVNVGNGIAISTDTVVAVVDGVTVKVNGSNQLEGLKPSKENLTLSGTDISNQYIDLAVTIASNSLNLSVDGVMQYEGLDYSLSTVSSKTRITFLGDLASGGSAALVSGDILRAQYMYL